MKDLNPQDSFSTRPLRVVIALCIVILLLSLKVCAQKYYPAGLGNTNLKLWLTTADPTTLKNAGGTQAASGDAIANWADKSGHSNNAVQATTANQPVYTSSMLNGYGGVIFQNTSQYMTGPSDAYQTIVAVRNMPLSSSGHYQYLFSSPANSDFSIRGGGASTGYTDGPNSNDWSYNTGTTPTQWINDLQSLGTSATNHILIVSAQSPTNATYSISSTFLSRGMTGNDPVYELIGYNTTLNTTQRRLLENYEGATWGLTSVLPSSFGTTPVTIPFAPPSLAVYNKNLVGIGYTSSTDNFLANAAGTTDGLGFSSGTGSTDFLNSPGFIMATHNGQTNSILSSITVTGVASNVNRWNRSWYIRQTGGNSTSGYLNFNFTFNDYNSSAAPSVTNDFKVLYNATDGSFATGTNKLIHVFSTTISGSTVSLQVASQNLPAGYYTIIWAATGILPIELSSFTATAQGNDGLLKWQVSGSSNAANFDIERSSDEQSFSVIGTVAANSGREAYSFIDNNPAAGSDYYRIKMTDLDGVSTYTPIRALAFDLSRQVSIATYPNPVTDEVQITTSNISGPVTTRLFTIGGMTAKTGYSASPSRISLSMQDLPAGIYILEVSTATNRYTQKILKR